MTRSTHPDEASARSWRNRRRSPARTFSYCKGRFFPSPTEVTLATVTAYPPPRKSHEKHHPLAMRRAHRRHHLVEGIRGLLRATRAIALLQGRSSSAVHDTAHAARRGSQAVTGQIRQGLRRARGGVKKSLRLWRDCSVSFRRWSGSFRDGLPLWVQAPRRDRLDSATAGPSRPSTVFCVIANARGSKLPKIFVPVT